jgi:glycosyltransferase involved in cell wall biosynthesis
MEIEKLHTRPSLVVLTSRFPYPLEKGDKLRLYFQIKSLSGEFDIYLFSITDQETSSNDIEQIRPLVKELHILRLDFLTRCVGVLSALFSGIPFQNGYFYQNKARKYISSQVLRISPDHIYCHLARMGEYAKHLPFPKTLDYMDSFGIGMERRAKLASWWQKWVYHAEAIRMKRYEADIFKHFDYHTIISEQDKSTLNFSGAEKITVNPNGVDRRFFEEVDQDRDIDLVFVGNMGYLPNVEAAEYIVHQILPLLPADIKLLISGARPHTRIKSLASNRVVVSGWVEDIRKSYKRAKICIAPLWSGTGQQNKILEAMALGVPCLTTPAVNSAIGATENREIVIADNAADFAFQIKQLLKNPVVADNIGKNAQSFVMQNYSWEKNALVLKRIFACAK